MFFGVVNVILTASNEIACFRVFYGPWTSFIAGEILDLLDKYLIPSAENSTTKLEAAVFYLKMKADYHRYLAEFKVGFPRGPQCLPSLREVPDSYPAPAPVPPCQVDDERKQAAEKTLAAYKRAQAVATENLSSTNPIRLGLALNFSVFYYEVMNEPQLACSLAKNVGREGQAWRKGKG